MRILSLLIFSIWLILSFRQIESPHGPGFKVSCNTCHSTKGWQLDKEIYKFDHNTTKLPLAGQHAEINCRQCHPNLVFAEAKTNCIDCHKDVHQSTLGPECSRCHTPASWLVDNTIEIHEISRFPLLGAHRTADCYQCHESGNLSIFNVQGVECIDCHREDYMATTNPNHTQSGFSEDCIICHQINAFQWDGAGFNHEFFPLTRAHSTLNCTDCHTTGNYSDASPECNSCHNDDYLATTNPDHSASNFSTNCSECHTTNPGWTPAVFDHTMFPLTLAHSALKCTDCHTTASYADASPECNSCHNDDYLATTNPSHTSLHFSTICTECHTTKPGWKPAAYIQHDSQSFPIYSGRHRGAWTSCTECHTNPSNYSIFSCLICHEHNQTEMNAKHREVSGYSYNSNECLRCHPQGIASD